MNPVSSDATPSAVSWVRTASIPASKAAKIAPRDGITAMITAAMTAPRTRSAASMTTPAALAAPQPRARRSVTYGASVAPGTSPRMIDAATVASCPAIPNRTTPNASVTSTRQPMAARRTSQPGTSGWSIDVAPPRSSTTLGCPDGFRGHRHPSCGACAAGIIAPALNLPVPTLPCGPGRVVMRSG